MQFGSSEIMFAAAVLEFHVKFASPAMVSKSSLRNLDGEDVLHLTNRAQLLGEIDAPDEAVRIHHREKRDRAKRAQDYDDQRKLSLIHKMGCGPGSEGERSSLASISGQYKYFADFTQPSNVVKIE